MQIYNVNKIINNDNTWVGIKSSNLDKAFMLNFHITAIFVCGFNFQPRLIIYVSTYHMATHNFHEVATHYVYDMFFSIM